MKLVFLMMIGVLLVFLMFFFSKGQVLRSCLLEMDFVQTAYENSGLQEKPLNGQPF